MVFIVCTPLPFCWFLVEVPEKPIYSGELPKKGGTISRFKGGGAWQKGGGWYPNADYDLAVYMKEWLSFAQDLSLKMSANSCIFFQLVLLHSVSYFCFLYRSLPLSLYTVFDAILSNIDEVLLINPSANVLVFGDFNVHRKYWLTFSSLTTSYLLKVTKFLVKFPSLNL